MDAPKTELLRKKSEKLYLTAGDSTPVAEWLSSCDAALLEADKNGYERGRKEIIEGISDLIGEHQDENDLFILRAVVQFIDKSKLVQGKDPMENNNNMIDDRPLTEKEIAHGLRIQIERDEALLRECYLAVNGVRFPELFEKLKARLAPSVGLTDAKEPK